MTRKDYIEAAKRIAEFEKTNAKGNVHHWKVLEQRKIMAKFMCEFFTADNPRFDEKRFLKACGLEKE